MLKEYIYIYIYIFLDIGIQKHLYTYLWKTRLDNATVPLSGPMMENMKLVFAAALHLKAVLTMGRGDGNSISCGYGHALTEDEHFLKRVLILVDFVAVVVLSLL